MPAQLSFSSLSQINKISYRLKRTNEIVYSPEIIKLMTSESAGYHSSYFISGLDRFVECYTFFPINNGLFEVSGMRVIMFVCIVRGNAE